MQKILLCDDTQIVLDVLKSMIKKQFPNCHVEFSTTAEECYNKAKKIVPDIIVIDLILPDYNGIELLKKLKGNDITKYSSTIMITGLVNNGKNKMKALEEGADAFLYKPIEYPQFISQLNLLFKLQQIEKELKTKKFSSTKNLNKLRVLTQELFEITSN